MLSGVRVLDLTQNAVGQCAASALGDLGASVVSITRPGYGDSRGYQRRQAVGRHKRSLVLDLKSPRGLEVFAKLAAATDVVLEGFRPGVAGRLGVDYAAVRELRPDVVYCSISGYGQTGPYRDLPGHDLNYLGVAGALHSGGSPEPELASNNWADRCATLQAQFAVVAALYARARDGKGRYLDVSITDSVLTLPASQSWGHPTIQRVLNGGPPGSESPRTPFLRGDYPAYQLYACADGAYLSLCCLEPWFWARFCEYLGRPEWTVEHQPDAGRAAEILAELRALFPTRPRETWLAELADRGVPVAPVNHPDDVPADPHLVERGSVVEVEVAGVPLRQLAPPFTIDGARPAIRRPAAVVGEDSAQILAELGLTPAQVADLMATGVAG